MFTVFPGLALCKLYEEMEIEKNKREAESRLYLNFKAGTLVRVVGREDVYTVVKDYGACVFVEELCIAINKKYLAEVSDE